MNLQNNSMIFKMSMNFSKNKNKNKKPMKLNNLKTRKNKR